MWVGRGRAGDILIEHALLGGRDEVSEKRAITGAVTAVEEVGEFSVVLVADPFAGRAFILQVFDCDKEAPIFCWEKLLGEDPDEVHGEETEGAFAMGGLKEMSEPFDGVVDS